MKLLETAVFFLLSFGVVAAIALFVQAQGLKYLGPKVAAFKARTAMSEPRRTVGEEPSLDDEPILNTRDDVIAAGQTDVGLHDCTVSTVESTCSGGSDTPTSNLSTKYSHIILDERSNARLFICHRNKPVAELRIGNKRIRQVPYLADEKLLELAGHMALKAHQAHQAQAVRAA